MLTVSPTTPDAILAALLMIYILAMRHPFYPCGNRRALSGYPLPLGAHSLEGARGMRSPLDQVITRSNDAIFMYGGAYSRAVAENTCLTPRGGPQNAPCRAPQR